MHHHKQRHTLKHTFKQKSVFWRWYNQVVQHFGIMQYKCNVQVWRSKLWNQDFGRTMDPSVIPKREHLSNSWSSQVSYILTLWQKTTISTFILPRPSYLHPAMALLPMSLCPPSCSRYGLSLKCSPQAHVLNNWSPVVALLWEAMEPLASGVG